MLYFFVKEKKNKIINFNFRYAIKLFKSFVNGEVELNHNHLPEIDILTKSDNEFIIKYIDNFIEFNRVCMVTVYYEVIF